MNIKAFSLMTGHPTKPEALWSDIREAIDPEHAGKKNVYPTHLPEDALDAVWYRFADGLAPFHDAGKLGAVLLQYPEWFTPKHDNREELGTRASGWVTCPLPWSSGRRCWLGKDDVDRTLGWLADHDLSLVAVDVPKVSKLPRRRRRRPTSRSCASTAAPTTRGRRAPRLRPSGSSTSRQARAPPLGGEGRGARVGGQRGARPVQQLLPGLRRPKRGGHDGDAHTRRPVMRGTQAPSAPAATDRHQIPEAVEELLRAPRRARRSRRRYCSLLVNGIYRDRARGEGFGELAAAYDHARPSVSDRTRELAFVSWRGRCGRRRVWNGTSGILARCRWLVGHSASSPTNGWLRSLEDYGIDVVCGAGPAMGSSWRDYDLVCSGTAWHRVDPTVGYDVAARVLRPGGQFAPSRNSYLYDPGVADALPAAVRRRSGPHLAQDCIPLGTSSGDLLGTHVSRSSSVRLCSLTSIGAWFHARAQR